MGSNQSKIWLWAAETVFTPEAVNTFELQEAESSKKGLIITATNGSEIKNFGKRSVKGFTGDWCPIEQDVIIAEVKREIASAIKIVKAGNRVILDEEVIIHWRQ